ncbi:ADC synthase [Martensiomyces pterosporus]|nr:ADC synthase [Martensiomyces pterosporus]
MKLHASLLIGLAVAESRYLTSEPFLNELLSSTDALSTASPAGNAGSRLLSLAASTSKPLPDHDTVADASRTATFVNITGSVSASRTAASPLTATLSYNPKTPLASVPTALATPAPAHPADFLCARTYIVQSGDTCWRIAQTFGLTTDALLSLNPDLNCNSLYIGQSVCLDANPTPPPQSQGGGNGGSCTMYTVKPGDSCWLITSIAGITQDRLNALNPGLDCNALYPGQVLCIATAQNPSNSTGSPPQGNTQCTTYTVVYGDTCYGIASRNGISPRDFLTFNPGIDCNHLTPGQQLCVSGGPVDNGNPQPNPDGSCKWHRVASESRHQSVTAEDTAVAGTIGQPRTLLVDNYDSYTFNLLQLLTQSAVASCSPGETSSNVIVIRNDQYPWETVRDQILPHVDNIIISPGPGSPLRQEDFGICAHLIRSSNKPLLGVCLGHQGIAAAFGGRVLRCDVPVHGQTSKVKITATSDVEGALNEPGLFDGIPDGFSVVRYHSLTVSDAPGDFPEELRVLGRAIGTVHKFKDGSGIEEVRASEIMALRHRDLPLFGVQFHPESICSEYGARIMENFHEITRHYYQTQLRAAKRVNSIGSAIPPSIRALSLVSLDDRMWSHRSRSRCDHQQTELATDGAQVDSSPRFSLLASAVNLDTAATSMYDGSELGDMLFSRLYGNDPMPIWLDSAKPGDANSSMSVMASASTATGATVRYTAHNRKVSVVRFAKSAFKCDKPTANQLHSVHLPDLDCEGNRVSFWTWMQSVVGETQISPNSADVQWIGGDASTNGGIDSLRFRCGWVGYFGYEMKSEAVATDPLHKDPVFVNEADGRMPDAQLSFIDRCVVLDQRHCPPKAFVLALVVNKQEGTAQDNNSDMKWIEKVACSQEDAEKWIHDQVASIKSWASSGLCALPRTAGPTTDAGATSVRVNPSPTLSLAEYISAIELAKEWIAQGESYEICLTNQFHLPLSAHSASIETPADMLSLYRCMRQRNPAPYGALLWYADINSGVASCSPERFLRIERSPRSSNATERWVEMKPIKGTSRRDPKPASACHGSASGPCSKCLSAWETEDQRRANDLQANVKERAENLMIVDLIRHDLNWIAQNGSVQVPRLMAIESYASVHQMVTTVRAQIRHSVGDVAALAHCFPPGSMTGAPKRRTLQILHGLEVAESSKNGSGDRKATPRGVYSGCLGYFSAHGEADWSVVIRTAVVDQAGKRLSVGAGGALTILSDPSEEWTEVETKLQSILPGIRSFISQSQKQQH